MRFFELLICLFIFILVAWMLLGARPARRGIRMLVILLFATLIVHLNAEGARWQMVPAYLAASIGLVWVLAGRPMAVGSIRWIVAGCLLLLVGTGVLSFMLPMFQLPRPTGEYAVGTRILYMVDASRKDEYGLAPTGHRELMVQAWYPAQPAGERLAAYRRREETSWFSSYQSLLRTHSFLDAAVRPAGAPYPVLIFNPAWTSQRTQSTFLMEELASHGFVVVSIDHTYYSGVVAFPDGRVIDARFAPRLEDFDHLTVDQVDALGDKYAQILAKDDSFVLDQLQALNQDSAGPFFGRLNMARVGVLGHSIGGAAAAEACFQDPRIQAALSLDGWIFGSVARNGLAKPFMLIYEGLYEEKWTPPFPASGTPFEQRSWQMDRMDTARMDATLHRYGGYRLFIEGASHWNFTDRPLYTPIRSWGYAGTIAPQLAHQIINRYAVAFFSHYLKGTPEPIIEKLPDEYPETTFEIWKSDLVNKAVATR